MDRKCLCFSMWSGFESLLWKFTLSVDPSELSCSDRTNRSCLGCLFSSRMKTVALSSLLRADWPFASMHAGPPAASCSQFVMTGPLLHLNATTPQKVTLMPPLDLRFRRNQTHGPIHSSTQTRQTSHSAPFHPQISQPGFTCSKRALSVQETGSIQTNRVGWFYLLTGPNVTDCVCLMVSGRAVSHYLRILWVHRAPAPLGPPSSCKSGLNICHFFS